MKLLSSAILLLLASTSFAQDHKVYSTTSGELIFSFADINASGSSQGSILRFSPVFNFQNWVNIDKSDHLGFFTGLSVRNVGFITDESSTVRKKYRTYNLGLPIGIKIGNLSDRFLFFGYEIELPFHYKEKTFVNEDKTDKINVWFSDRTPTFTHSLMAGFQLPYGATIKFKYYLTNFFNKSFQADDGSGNITQPFANADVNVFYFSLNFGLLKNTGFYYNDK